MIKPDYVLYPAYFDIEDNGHRYVANFPDLPDVTAEGAALEEAIRNASDALAAALLEYDEYPLSTDIKKMRTKYPANPVVSIGADMKAALNDTKTTSREVNIPINLAIKADEQNIDLSKLLTEVLEEELD